LPRSRPAWHVAPGGAWFGESCPGRRGNRSVGRRGRASTDQSRTGVSDGSARTEMVSREARLALVGTDKPWRVARRAGIWRVMRFASVWLVGSGREAVGAGSTRGGLSCGFGRGCRQRRRGLSCLTTGAIRSVENASNGVAESDVNKGCDDAEMGWEVGTGTGAGGRLKRRGIACQEGAQYGLSRGLWSEGWACRLRSGKAGLGQSAVGELKGTGSRPADGRGVSLWRTGVSSRGNGAVDGGWIVGRHGVHGVVGWVWVSQSVDKARGGSG